MTSFVTDAALFLGGRPDLALVAKVTVLLLLGLGAAWLAGRQRASVRHLLLAATFVSLLVLPPASVIGPAIAIPLARADAADRIAAGASAVTLPGSGAAAVNPDAATRAQDDRAQPPWSFTAMLAALTPTFASSLSALASFMSALASSIAAFMASVAGPSSNAMSKAGRIAWLVWMAGAVFGLASLAIAVWRVRRLRREGLPWPDMHEATRALAAERGIHRPVEILLHEAIVAPLTCGVWRPAIFLPSDACEWTGADLRRALVHELEHVRRADWIVQLAARAAWACYWFHPLAWVAWRRLCLEAERACDDAVVQGAEEMEYADQLVALARRMTNGDAYPMPGMARRSDLSTRVSALLDARQPRGRAGTSVAIVALSAAALVVLGLAPLRAVAQPDAEQAAAAATPSAIGGAGAGSGAGSGSGANSGSGAGAGTGGGIGAGRDAGVAAGSGAGNDAGSGAGSDAGTGAGADAGNDAEQPDSTRAAAPARRRVSGLDRALFEAASNGDRKEVATLIDAGASVDAAIGQDGSPLIAAARGGHLDVVTLLLDRGADIDLVVPGDENALIQASGSGHLGVVQLLVQRGADVNARVWADKSGGRSGEWRTPLGMARRGRHTHVVDFLLSAGASE